MEITVVKNFLTKEEILDIRKKVYELKDLWVIAHPEKQKDLVSEGGLYTLGNSIYLYRDRYPKIDINKILVNNFGEIFERIRLNLEKKSGVKTEFSKALPCPGFHISNITKTVKGDITNFLHFHVDETIKVIYPEVSLSKVNSMLILIESPVVGSFLEYKNKRGITQFPYRYGNLNYWNGGLQKHRMGGLVCKEGEARITLQCHSYYDEKENKNIIYF